MRSSAREFLQAPPAPYWTLCRQGNLTHLVPDAFMMHSCLHRTKCCLLTHQPNTANIDAGQTPGAATLQVDYLVTLAVWMQGYHSGSLIVALLGIFKAVVGLLIRPAVGTLELVGKSAHGVGLLFLGREGISGTIQKRARAPGTLTDDSDEVICGRSRPHWPAC